jgi:plastocyanin
MTPRFGGSHPGVRRSVPAGWKNLDRRRERAARPIRDGIGGEPLTMQVEHARQRGLSTLLVVFAVPLVALLAVIVTRVVAGPSEVSAAAPGANAVVIKNFAFAPDKVSVAKGTAIKVTNEDGAAHTFSAKDGSFNTGDLGGGATKTVKVEQAGTFDVYCKIHTYMTGTLVVR